MRVYNTPDDNYDPAHEEDMRVLMLEQLRSNISAEEANEEFQEQEDIWLYDDYD